MQMELGGVMALLSPECPDSCTLFVQVSFCEAAQGEALGKAEAAQLRQSQPLLALHPRHPRQGANNTKGKDLCPAAKPDGLTVRCSREGTLKAHFLAALTVCPGKEGPPGQQPPQHHPPQLPQGSCALPAGTQGLEAWSSLLNSNCSLGV